MKPSRMLIPILLLTLGAQPVSGSVDVSGDLQADLQRKVRLEADAARRMSEAEDHFLRGMKLRKSQNHDLSTQEFRRAEAVVLDAGEEEYFETSLRGYLHELRSRVAAMAGSLPSAPDRSNPIPLTATDLSVFSVDPRTQAWIDRAVRRPIPQEPLIRGIFRETGVPEDLIYVGLVESGFDTTAVSSAGAVGAWQFIGETGRRYGLRSGASQDERRDFLKSTRAAARYLRDLHELLGDWTLVLAGYNSGEYRVLRAMQKAGSRDFERIKSLLPLETSQYVSRVFAAISLASRQNVSRQGPRSGKPEIESRGSMAFE